MFRTAVFLSCIGFLIAAEDPASLTVKRDYRSLSLVPLTAEQAESVQHTATPGVDFPVLDQVPLTSFSCKTMRAIPADSYFADPETGCQAFHKCSLEGEIAGSYLCPNYTIFDDQAQTCKWFHDVECSAEYRPAIQTVTTYVEMPQVVPVSPIVIASRPSATVISSDCCKQQAISSVVPVVIESAPAPVVVATSQSQVLSNINLIPLNQRAHKKLRARRPKKTVAATATLSVIPIRPESEAGSAVEIETTDVEIPVVANIPIFTTVQQQSSSAAEQSQQNRQIPRTTTTPSSQTRPASLQPSRSSQSGWGAKATTQPPAVPSSRSGWGSGSSHSAPAQQSPVLGSGLGFMNPMGMMGGMGMGGLGMGGLFGGGGIFNMVPMFANGIATTFLSPFAFLG